MNLLQTYIYYGVITLPSKSYKNTYITNIVHFWKNSTVVLAIFKKTREKVDRFNVLAIIKIQ